jgi:hypothetical protein
MVHSAALTGIAEQIRRNFRGSPQDVICERFVPGCSLLGRNLSGPQLKIVGRSLVALKVESIGGHGSTGGLEVQALIYVTPVQGVQDIDG